jgi:hypothetical protein
VFQTINEQAPAAKRAGIAFIGRRVHIEKHACRLCPCREGHLCLETLQYEGHPKESCQALFVDQPDFKPVKQRLRCFDEEKCRAIGEEVGNLLADGFIREIHHPEWLDNLVLIWKKSGKLRMCVDYTNINKACLKDLFPLMCIDQVVDSTFSCEVLSFLVAYLGYNHTMMKEYNQPANSFIMPFGSYYYMTMSFGLKSVGATYQWCIIKCFGDLIIRVMEAYVDDIMVKTRRSEGLITNLRLMFERLKANEIKLNPKKCLFPVLGGMLLGFLVSEQGIEANLEKVMAITNMGPIRDLKGVQRVMRCLASLNHFISHLGERGLLLYKLMWKTDRFEWTMEKQEALNSLKTLLTQAPVLVPLEDKEPLLLYMAGTAQVVSSVPIVKNREEGNTHPL